MLQLCKTLLWVMHIDECCQLA